MDVILYSKINKIAEDVGKITPWIQQEEFDGSYTNLYRNNNNGKIDSSDAIKSAIIKVNPGDKYVISARGNFNRFGVYGCSGNVVGSNASEAYTFVNTVMSNAEYTYVNSDNYQYLLVLLAYSYPSFECKLSIMHEKHNSEDIEVSTLNYALNAGKIDDRYPGKIAYCPLMNEGFYKVTVKGTYNRFVIGTADAVTNGASYTTIYNSGSSSQRTDTEESYSFKNNSAQQFLLVFYNYDGASLSDAEVTIEETIMDGVFSVNGEQVYTAKQIDDIVENKSGFPFYTTAQEIELLTQSSGVFALYDELVSDYPEYVEKTTLGTDSNSKTVYAYQFGNGQYNSAGTRARDTATDKPVILFIAGVHGYERSAVMSTYEFFYDLCHGDPKLCYLRENYIFKVIPIVCPDEYDNDKRINKNSVNINRNFDADWESSGSGTQDYSGAAAADQPETQIVQDFIDDNADAVLFVDHHNSGYAEEVSYLAGKNSVTGITDLKNVFIKRGYEIAPYFVNIESFDNDLIFAYTGDFSATGMSYQYAVKQGIMGCCLETSWNQNDTGKHSSTTFRAGAIVIGNMLNAFVGK